MGRSWELGAVVGNYEQKLGIRGSSWELGAEAGN